MTAAQKRPLAIITRPIEDAAYLADLVRREGGAAVISPVMSIRYGEEELDLSGIGALAFTSANGVRAFIAQTERRDLPVFPVGPFTADIARHAGFKDVRTADSDVESLARLAIAHKHLSGEILHVSGKDSAGDLVGALSAAGVCARRHVGYWAQPVDHVSASAKRALLDVAERVFVFLLSPRSAALFIDQIAAADLLPRLEDAHAICLSNAVARKAQAANWRTVTTSAERQTASMIDCFREIAGADA